MESLRAHPPPASSANICLDCGDKGEVDLLIFCRKCRDSAVHHYCLGRPPDDDNINWLCWDCTSIDNNAEPPRKSQRITAKRQEVLKTRYNLKRLIQNKRRVGIGNGVDETALLAKEEHLQTADVKIQHGTSGKKNSRLQIQCHSDDHSESIRTDEPTHASESALPEKSSLVLSDTNRTIQDVANNVILGENNNSTKSPDDHKVIDLQVPPLAACTETFHIQNFADSDHYLFAEPISDPIWRGVFKINEESETPLEMLAHPSTKASPKVFDAAKAFSALLDIQVLDKQVLMPKRFRVSPPTAGCIALYFFPAHNRVEKEFDILLDTIIERDLALKAVIHDVELLIFSSRELPIQHWRHRNKYYLWGVFRRKQCCRLPKDMNIPAIPTNSGIDSSRLCKTELANNKDDGDKVSSPSQQSNQSRSSKNSSESSNLVRSSITH